MKSGSNEIFSANGQIGIKDGRNVFVPSSPPYVRDRLSKMKVGQKCQMTLTETRAIRTPAQLKYHMVLMGYLGEYTGCTKEEMHDAVMRIHFGEKTVRVGNFVTKVRRSVSDEARIENHDMSTLIEFDLGLCAELEIRVPTAEELGYLPNKKLMVK